MRHGPVGIGGGRIADALLELGAPGGVARDDLPALFVARDLRLLGHQRSSRKSTCLRTTGSYLRSTIRSGSLRRFFRVTYVYPVPAVDFSLMIGRISVDFDAMVVLSDLFA